MKDLFRFYVSEALEVSEHPVFAIVCHLLTITRMHKSGSDMSLF